MKFSKQFYASIPGARIVRHHHKPMREVEVTKFDGCVAPGKCNAASHDGMCRLEECECGCVRLVNFNGGYVEKGRWYQR